MAVILLGGLYGIYEHVAHNLAFEMEIKPNATAGEGFWKALYGASPLLAPGTLSRWPFWRWRLFTSTRS